VNLLVEECIEIDVFRVEQPLIHSAAKRADKEAGLRFGIDTASDGPGT
jgi:hypothetical protein